MIIRVFLISLGIFIAFIGGMEYENKIAKERFEIVSAILITANAHQNFTFQRKQYDEIERYIQSGNLVKLQRTISKQKELIEYMIQNAETFCQRESCTSEDLEYLKRSFQETTKN